MSKQIKKYGKLGIDLAKTGVALGVSGAIVGKASQLYPGVAPIGNGISIASSFVPIATTAYAGKIALDSLKPLQKFKY